MVRLLDRKLLRDLLRMKLQVITIALVLASGIAALIAFLSTQASLKRAREQFYQQSRFAEVFAELKRAPDSLARRLEIIPGIVALETRIIQDFLLDMPDRAEAAMGRFISLPDEGLPRLNRIYLRQGRLPDPLRNDEVIVSEGFFEANHLKLGDKVGAIVNGKYKKFLLVGTALSPEYIYAIRGETPVPDDRQFGIFWAPRQDLEAALDLAGSFNSLVIRLGPASHLQEVIDRLDRELLRFGGRGAYGRKDQVSHRFLNDEINQQTVMAVAIPVVFLTVAAFLLNVVLSRMIGIQRSQIATLKAVGYSNFTISVHYAKMTSVIVLFGLILGSLVGFWMGRELTRLYTDFYRFPILSYSVSPALIALAAGVGFFAAFLGVISALRQVFRLQPAVAMRPPEPPAFHLNVWERLGTTRRLSTTGKMVFRNLTLRPWRTLMAVLGIASAVMVTMIGMFWWDTVNYVIFSQYFVTQREDAEVIFVNPVPARALQELQKVPGVLETEAYRALPVRLRLGHRSVASGLLGYPSEAKLRRLLNKNWKNVPLPPEGILLTQLLARKLKANPGDFVEIEVLEGKRQKWSLPVTALVDQWVGFAAYMSLGTLKRLTDEDSISFAMVDWDPRSVGEFHRALKKMPAVAAVNNKRNVLRMFENTMARFILVFASVLTAFALVIAVGVVYNSARVTLSERTWELMSLRILGFTRREVFRILSREIVVQMAAALPLGWLLGYLFSTLLVKLMHTESFEIPLIIERSTFAYASFVILASGLASAWILRRRLARTHLVEALKVRE